MDDVLLWVHGSLNHFRWDSEDLDGWVKCDYCEDVVAWSDAWEFGYDGEEPDKIACEDCFQEMEEAVVMLDDRR